MSRLAQSVASLVGNITWIVSEFLSSSPCSKKLFLLLNPEPLEVEWP